MATSQIPLGRPTQMPSRQMPNQVIKCSLDAVNGYRKSPRLEAQRKSAQVLKAKDSQKEDWEKSRCAQLRKRGSAHSLKDLDIQRRPKIAAVELVNKPPKCLSCTPLKSSADPLPSPMTELSNVIAFLDFTQSKVRLSSSSSSSGDSTSSSDSCPPSPVIEELIMPVQVCPNEAVPMFPVRVLHPTNSFQWVATGPNGWIQWSPDSGEYELYAWRVSGFNNIYVFGFKDGSTVYYVETPTSPGNFLRLTTTGSHPDSISNPSSDRRCIKAGFDSAMGKYLLQPAYDPNAWISIRSGYVFLQSSVNDALSWRVEPV